MGQVQNEIGRTMRFISIVTKWNNNAIEYLNIDLSKARSKPTTREHWPGHNSGWGEYLTHCKVADLGGKRFTLTLDYLREQNQSLLSFDVRYGTATYELDFGLKRSATAHWFDDKNSKYSGHAQSCEILALGEPLTVDEIVFEEVRRIRRRKAEALRNKLYGLDLGCCALSGETAKDALDVAHILEVHQSGSDALSNVFLLRTDLHRLFDRGLVDFSPLTGHATFNGLHADSLYIEEFRGKGLRQQVFSRVAKALANRRMAQGRSSKECH